MHEEGAVRLEHQQADRLGEAGRQAAGVDDLAAGDDQAAWPADRTVRFGRSVPRRLRAALCPFQCPVAQRMRPITPIAMDGSAVSFQPQYFPQFTPARVRGGG
jgi:hypothetical protein